MLDHLVDNIEYAGCIEVSHGGIYESTHKHFKNFNRITAKRLNTAMEEAIQEYSDSNLVNRNSLHFSGEKNGSERKVRSVMIDRCSIVDNGSSCLLYKLERVLQVGFDEQCAVEVKTHILKLGRVLCDDGLYSMIDLIREHKKKNGLHIAEARHTRFHMPTSAYVSGHIAPTLVNATLRGAVFSPRSSFRLSQRLVSKVVFYGAEKIRMDDVTVEVEVEYLNPLQTHYIPIRLVKARAFLRSEGGRLKSRTHEGDIASEVSGEGNR